MTSLNLINNKLRSLGVSSGFSDLVSSTSSIASSIQALNSSSLGDTLNETISGVQVLNTSADPKKGMAILTENIPGLQSQIVKDVSSSQTALNAITGASVGDGFLDAVITNPTAEGIKTAIGAIATPSDSQLSGILTNVLPSQYSSQIGDLVSKDFTAFASDFSTSVGAFTSAFSNLLGSKTGNLLQDVFLSVDNTSLSIIENLGVTPEQSPEVLKQVLAGDKSQAVEDVVKTTKLPTETVEKALDQVPENIASQVDSPLKGESTTEVLDVTSKANEWKGAKTPDVFFEMVSTQEYLNVEFLKSTREITEIVFYGHEMTANQILTANDIHKTYVEAGSDGMPFHYVVLPNGNLQKGRTIFKAGDHSDTHSDYSIAIVVPHIKDTSATVKQGETIRMIAETFYEVWPGGQIFDAQLDIGESEVEVGVPIASIVESFKKINKGSTARSFSTKQLIAAAQGSI